MTLKSGEGLNGMSKIPSESDRPPRQLQIARAFSLFAGSPH
jgi:hypothetical protein